MNDDLKQIKPIAEKSKQSNNIPSKEAIEIAAKVMANRTKRELKKNLQKTPNLKGKYQ